MVSYFLIFDDHCPICRRAASRVRKLDTLGVVELVPLSCATMTGGQSLPSPELLANKVHLISREGTIFTGADAVGQLAGLFPRSRLLGQFILLPGVRQIARRVYSTIARHRLKLSQPLQCKPH
ncbi:MAG: DUF393 domain-containing protein [candidate division Zixibacteria bacterium]|nr:DUF393 domain-containing protein [candidate division Zixibacteria bacterium]